MKLTIGKLRMEDVGNFVVLSTDIRYNDESFSLEYEYDHRMKEYIVHERADAFLVSLLPYAMMKARGDAQLVIETLTPVSEELYHQLVNYQIPVLEKNISYYKNVKILPNVSSEPLYSSGAVATGVSGGVDSSYTLAKYSGDENKNFKLTHGIFYNLGMYDGYTSQAEKNLEDNSRKICEQLGIEFVKIKNNIIEKVYKKCYGPIVPSVMMGGILSLQKLFSVYYLSAEVAAEEICFSEDYACFYDWLSTSNYSTKNTRFYCSGIELKRLDKIKYISQIEFVRKHLSVCIHANELGKNCSKCAKCTTAMVSLDAIGELNNFSQCFDVEKYNNNLDYYLSYVIMKNKGNDLWCREIYKEYIKNKGKFPASAESEAQRKFLGRGGSSENPLKERIEDFIK